MGYKNRFRQKHKSRCKVGNRSGPIRKLESRYHMLLDQSDCLTPIYVAEYLGFFEFFSQVPRQPMLFQRGSSRLRQGKLWCPLFPGLDDVPCLGSTHAGSSPPKEMCPRSRGVNFRVPADVRVDTVGNQTTYRTI